VRIRGAELRATKLTDETMNLRHRAALALVGWYLMVPSPSSAAGGSKAPSGQDSADSQIRDEIENEWYDMCPPFTDPPGVAVDAPFTKWEMATHWPNRQECEEDRAGVAKLASEHSDKESRVVMTAAQHCLCFSSNDPRLDQKSVRDIKDDYLDQAYREGLLKRPPK
jgi:hypothetical protein